LTAEESGGGGPRGKAGACDAQKVQRTAKKGGKRGNTGGGERQATQTLHRTVIGVHRGEVAFIKEKKDPIPGNRTNPCKPTTKANKEKRFRGGPKKSVRKWRHIKGRSSQGGKGTIRHDVKEHGGIGNLSGKGDRANRASRSAGLKKAGENTWGKKNKGEAPRPGRRKTLKEGAKTKAYDSPRLREKENEKKKANASLYLLLKKEPARLQRGRNWEKGFACPARPQETSENEFRRALNLTEERRSTRYLNPTTREGGGWGEKCSRYLKKALETRNPPACSKKKTSREKEKPHI